MTQVRHVLSLTVITFALVFAVACGQQSNCSGAGFSSSGGSGSGSSGGVNSGGSVCGSGNNSGGGGNNGSISDFLYYLSYDTTSASPTTNTVQAATLSSTGTFAGIANFNAPSFSFDASQNMAIVNKQFLYIPQPALNQIQAFSINRTSGALTLISGSPFSTSGGGSVASDPQGHFLFVGSSTNGLISVFQIDSATGALTQNSNSPFATTLLFSYFLNVDGQGKYLYVSQHNSSLPTAVFSIDSTTGDLQSVGSFSLGVSGGFIASPSGAPNEYYIAGSGLSGDHNLYIFAIDPTTGVPSPVSGSPFPTANTPNFVNIHPSGTFFYVQEYDSGQVGPFEGFQLNSTNGSLTAISGSPFSSLSNMLECQFDQAGSNAFCASSTGYTALTVNSSTGVPTTTGSELQTSPFVFAVTN
jgi:6-phosphogluconolactonase